MPKEPNQAKWVGIRPTDPSENIPVTESSPLTSIQTRKLTPAISDLQAIEEVLLKNESKSIALGASYNFDTPTVPAGTIWVITDICTFIDTATCSYIAHCIFEVAVNKGYLNVVATPVPFTALHTIGTIILTADQYIRAIVKTTTGALKGRNTVNGYQINIY